MEIKAKVVDHLPAGEFINSDGEVISWGERSEIYAYFPGEEFPAKFFIKGHQPLGDGVLNVRFTTKKDRPEIQIGAFRLAEKKV